MTVAPVRCSVDVRQPPSVAFEIFTLRISQWWIGKAISKRERASITIEPFAGGRWFETDIDGLETPWGKVLVWAPPARLVLVWELNSRFEPDPEIQTEIELVFQPLPGGGTQVRLEHRNLERFGADSAAVATSIGKGWPTQLAGFAGLAAEENPKVSE